MQHVNDLSTRLKNQFKINFALYSKTIEQCKKKLKERKIQI